MTFEKQLRVEVEKHDSISDYFSSLNGPISFLFMHKFPGVVSFLP